MFSALDVAHPVRLTGKYSISEMVWCKNYENWYASLYGTGISYAYL
jgi:hypothetical protein